MSRSNDILSYSKIRRDVQYDTASRFRYVIMQYIRNAKYTDNKTNLLRSIDRFLVEAESITTGSSNNMVIVEHEDGSKVLFSQEDFTFINEALSQIEIRASHSDASMPQTDSRARGSSLL